MSVKKLLALIIFAALGALFGCQKGGPESDARSRPPQGSEPLMAVRVLEIKAKKVHKEVRATGSVHPRSEAKIMAQIDGQLVDVLVREGDLVKKGDILARIDDTIYKIQLGLARSELLSARAKLKKLKAGNLPQEISRAEAVVHQAEAQIKRTAAEVESARAKLAEAKENSRAIDNLFQQGVISSQQRLAFATQANTAQAQLAENEAKHNEARAALAAAKENLNLLKAGFRVEDIEAAAGEVERAEQSINLLRAKLEYSIIKAPFDSVISSRLLEPGDLASPGKHLLTITDSYSLKVRGQISELDLPMIRLEQDVDLVIDAAPGVAMKGRVDNIFPTVDQLSRLATVEVAFENRDLAIKPGTFARLFFKALSDEKRISLPKEALIGEEAGGHTIFLAEQTAQDGAIPSRGTSPGKGPAPAASKGMHTIIKRIVKIGAVRDDGVEVVAGLREGEKVVVSGLNGLRPGMKVRVAKD